MKTLKQHRREQALSIRDLAAAAGVANQTIVSAEEGKPLRMVSIRKISEALGVKPMEIEEFAAIIAGNESDSE